ncbi:hypothetical protein CH341_31105, partial [Rhodoplanes roseus]
MTARATALPATMRRLPSVDAVLRTDGAAVAVAQFGRPATVAAVRTALDETRAALAGGA